MAEQNASVIDDMKDLGAIVDSVKASTTAVNKIAAASVSMTEKIDASAMTKVTKQAAIITESVQNFVENIYGIIEYLTENIDQKKADKLNKLFIDANEYLLNPDGTIKTDPKTGQKLIKESHVTIPTILSNVANSLTKIFDAMSRLGEINNVKSMLGIVTLKYKLMFFKKSIFELVQMMMDLGKEFSGEQYGAIFNSLISEPEEITETLKEQDNNTKEGDNKVISEKITDTVKKTQKGKQGILDMIINTLNIMNTLNNLKMPNFIMFELNLMSLRFSLWQVIRVLAGTVKDFNEQCLNTKGIQELAQNLEEINIVVMTVSRLNKTLTSELSAKNIIGTLFVGLAFSMLKSVIKHLGEFNKNPNFEIYKDPKNSQGLKTAFGTIGTIMATITDTLKNVLLAELCATSMIALAVPATIGIYMTILFIYNVRKLMGVLNDIFVPVDEVTEDGVVKVAAKNQIDYDTIVENVSKISEIITKLVIISLLSTAGIITFITGTVGLLTMCAFLFIFGIAVNMLNKMAKMLDDPKNGAMHTLNSICLALLIFSTAVLIMVAIGATMDWGWEKFAYLAALLGTICVVFFLLGLGSQLIKDGSRAIIFIAAGLFVFSVAVLIMVAIGAAMDWSWEKYGYLVALLGAITAIFFLLGLGSQLMIQGAMAILFIGAGLAIAAVGILLLVAVCSLLSWDWNNYWFLMAVSGIILAIGGTFAALGFASPFIAAGAAAMLIAGVALIAISVGLLTIIGVSKKMQELGDNEETLKTTVTQPIEVMKSVVDAVNKIGLKAVTKAMIKMIQLSVIALNLSYLAEVIKKFATLEIPTEFDAKGKPIKFSKIQKEDFATAKTNVTAVLNCILESISNDTISKLLENMSLKTAINIALIGTASSSLINLADVISKFASLSIPTGFDDKGKPIGYRAMTEEDFVKTSENVAKVLKTILGAMGSDEVTETLDGMSRKSRKNLKAISESFGGFSELIKTVLDKNFNSDEVSKKSETLKACIKSYFDSVISLFVKQNGADPYIKEDDCDTAIDSLKMLKKVADKYKDFYDVMNESSGDAVKKGTDELTKFINTTNSVNTDKIESVTALFGKMAEFSKSINGNFEKLADVLSDKLIDILSKLHDTLAGLNGITTNISSNISNSNTSSSSVTNTNGNKTEDKKDSNAIDPAALQNIEDYLSEMSTILREIKENTETRIGF